jgi:TatD DNase family protein
MPINEVIKLIDTHCHINNMVKKEFDIPLTPADLPLAQEIIDQAAHEKISTIINVGTSVAESKNCILLAQQFSSIYASIGIHPNDCSTAWRADFDELAKLAQQKEEHKIVAIGECGLDFHYPDFNVQRQKDAFKAQIELALEHALPVVVHTRQAPDETLRVLEEYAHQLRATIHCFSEDLSFAQQVIAWNMVIGIGGTITYPKNDQLRDVVKKVDLTSIVLETDAPFLPPQIIRGQQNHPKYIATIAHYIAELRNEPFETVAAQTTQNATALFRLP